MSVSREQKFLDGRTCPICGGNTQAAAGSGERCWGFIEQDGKHVICTETESPDYIEKATGWRHDLPESNGSGPPENIAIPRVSPQRLTVKQYADEKHLPIELLRNLGLLNGAAGVLFPFTRDVAKVRRRGEQRFGWLGEGGGKAERFPLFPVPDSTLGEVIYLTAGETDMLTMRAAGYEAYAITTGEKKTAVLTQAHYRQMLAWGMKRAIICPDADDQGQAWGPNEARAAQLAGAEVATIDLTPFYNPFTGSGKDLNDLWIATGDVDAFRDLVTDQTQARVQVSVYSLEDLQRIEQEPEEWIVPGLLSPGEKGALVGPPKSHKTWIALNLARAVAAGECFLGRECWRVDRPRPVLVIEEEGNLHKFAQRMTRTFRDHKDAPVYLIPRMGFSLFEKAHVDWLIRQIQQRDAGLCVLDPWQRIIPGASEDRSHETGPAWDAIHQITVDCPYCALFVIHHANKAGGLSLSAIRGSTRFPGEVDMVMVVTRGQQRGEIPAILEGRDLAQVEDEGDGMQITFPVEDPIEMDATPFEIADLKKTLLGDITSRSEIPGVLKDVMTREWQTTTEVIEGVCARMDNPPTTREAVLKHMRDVYEQQKNPGHETQWRIPRSSDDQ